jgi:hypothetical protein
VAHVCGQSGILLRLQGDVVERLAEGEADLYGMAVFKGVVYVASETAVFSLDGPDLTEVSC